MTHHQHLLRRIGVLIRNVGLVCGLLAISSVLVRRSLDPATTWHVEAGVNQLVLHPNGTLLASADVDGVVRVRSVPQGELVRELATITRGSAVSVAFSADGTLLATGSRGRTATGAPDRTAARITIWRVTDGTLLQTLSATRASVDTVAFSPDGQWLAAGGYDFDERGAFAAPVSVWHVPSWRLHYQTLNTGPVRALAFSPDATVLATEDSLGVSLWAAHTGHFHRHLPIDSTALNGLQFSPNGQWLAAGDSNRRVYVWEATSGRLQHILKGHTDQVMSVAWHPTSQHLATASGINAWKQPFGPEAVTGDHTIRIWDVTTGHLVQTIDAHTEVIGGLVWTNTGTHLISGSLDQRLRTWSIQELARK